MQPTMTYQMDLSALTVINSAQSSWEKECKNHCSFSKFKKVYESLNLQSKKTGKWDQLQAR
jgi:hypothetical protein